MNVQQTADSHMFARRIAICVAASLVFIVLSLTSASSDLGAVLCFGIALVSALLLFVFGVAKKGRQRLATLFVVMTYVLAAMLLKSNYSLVRDHVRWLFLSGGYKVKVLAQPPSEELKHAEWDGWGLLEKTRQCSWSSIRRTHLQVRLRHPHRLNHRLCRVKSSESVALNASGMPCCFTPTPIGDKVLASDDWWSSGPKDRQHDGAMRLPDSGRSSTGWIGSRD